MSYNIEDDLDIPESVKNMDIPDDDEETSNLNQSHISKGSFRQSEKYINYQNIPLNLIDFTNKGFSVNPKALEFLNSIKDEIIVVSVVGKARTGKSYLMNLLLDLVGKGKNGFQVASSLQSCTKGIWLWGNIKNSTNGSAKIIFIDSEGTSSTDKSTKTYDSRIFALIVLVSSLFLYNTYSNIDEKGIGELSLAAHISQAITTNSGVDKNDLISELAPNFIWIIRDFALKLEHPETGESISSKDYLELCLRMKNKSSKLGNENNVIRENILKYFPNRDCITLPRPVDKDEDLKNLKNIPFSKLKSSFRQEFTILKNKIFKEAVPKKYNGKRLNGPSLAKLISEFVSIINSGEIPNINNTWDSIIENDINEHFNKSVKYFKEKSLKLKLSEKNVLNENILLQKLLKYKYDSIEIFNEIIKINSDTFSYKIYNDLYNENKNKLINLIDNTIKKQIDVNNTNSKIFCQKVFKNSFKNIENKINKNNYNIKNLNEISNDFNLFLNDYYKNSNGEKKEEILFNNLIKKENNLIEFLKEIFNKNLNEEENKLNKKLKIEKAEKENEINNKRIKKEKEKILKEKLNDLNKEQEKLNEEINELEDLLNTKNDQLEKIKELNLQKKKNKVILKNNIKKMKERKNNNNNNKKENNNNCCLIF